MSRLSRPRYQRRKTRGFTTRDVGDEIRRVVSLGQYRRELATGVSTKFNGVTIDSYSYSYDALSRPTSRNSDTFGYNERGEVVFSRRDAENAEDAYAYDGIGNLQIAAFNFVTNTYTANNLNQYTSIQNISAPLREISHDLDGNMTSDGVFTYTYDSENRLASVSSNGIVLVANEYDYRGRRIRKTTPTMETTFVYDGWNLIHETVATFSGATTNITEIQYFWGTDLSDTFQDAGGVGGLLAVSINGDFYFPAMDNNGNITKYIDENGNVVAEYTYNAFGKTISQTGSLADFFRHRFSSKYYDTETGLYYYGYRFYSPMHMRWLNRDPIEEEGGVNMYWFCGNCCCRYVDELGKSLYIKDDHEPPRHNILTANTWNTLTPASSTFGIRFRAKLTMLGGEIKSMPDAARHFRHFLDNSGTPLEIRFRKMNQEDPSARSHLENELADGILYAEKLADSDGSFIMVTPSETSSSAARGNWLYAVGEYTTWARASVVKCGNFFSMNWHFYFRDIYDWELGSEMQGGLVTDGEMALLHRYGQAKEFEMNGRQFLHVEWKKGQKMHFGAKISGL